MKKTGIFFILLSTLCFAAVYREQIISFIIYDIIDQTDVNLEYKNDYYLDYKFDYVENVNDFNIYNMDSLIDLYYTIINSGVNTFEFMCPKEYKNCINDVIEIANNSDYLSDINGFVHPFNSFDTIETTYDSIGRVKLRIIKTYTDLEIEAINDKVKEIVENEVKDTKDTREIIKIIHDYIINNSKYDKLRADENIIKYSSNTAYGVLFEGYGICSGYADAMAIFLDYYDIPNFKVSSSNHVWNAVYLDNNWYHLDLTWDDPVLDTGEDVLDHSYFLITDTKLKELDKLQHTYNEKIFSEFNQK